MNREQLTIALLSKVDKQLVLNHFKNNKVRTEEDKINFVLGYVISKTFDILEEQGVIE
jgi:hypothetical protein